MNVFSKSYQWKAFVLKPWMRKLWHRKTFMPTGWQRTEWSVTDDCFTLRRKCCVNLTATSVTSIDSQTLRAAERSDTNRETSPYGHRRSINRRLTGDSLSVQITRPLQLTRSSIHLRLRSKLLVSPACQQRKQSTGHLSAGHETAIECVFLSARTEWAMGKLTEPFVNRLKMDGHARRTGK